MIYKLHYITKMRRYPISVNDKQSENVINQYCSHCNLVIIIICIVCGVLFTPVGLLIVILYLLFG